MIIRTFLFSLYFYWYVVGEMNLIIPSRQARPESRGYRWTSWKLLGLLSTLYRRMQYLASGQR